MTLFKNIILSLAVVLTWASSSQARESFIHFGGHPAKWSDLDGWAPFSKQPFTPDALDDALNTPSVRVLLVVLGDSVEAMHLSSVANEVIDDRFPFGMVRISDPDLLDVRQGLLRAWGQRLSPARRPIGVFLLWNDLNLPRRRLRSFDILPGAALSLTAEQIDERMRSAFQEWHSAR